MMIYDLLEKKPKISPYISSLNVWKYFRNKQPACPVRRLPDLYLVHQSFFPSKKKQNSLYKNASLKSQSIYLQGNCLKTSRGPAKQKACLQRKLKNRAVSQTKAHQLQMLSPWM